ncbi:MAG: hypothetical protein PGN22_15570 [Agrobacterium cavarae]
MTSSLVASDGLYSFDPMGNRIVENYVGPTIRLAKGTDSTQQRDFTPNLVTGMLDKAAVLAWDASPTYVRVYDQNGSAVVLAAEGIVKFANAGVPYSFGVTADGSKRLTRNGLGGCGAYLGDDQGNFRLSGAALDQAFGVEVHMALSFMERKITSAVVPNDAYGGNASVENIFSWYGANTANGAYVAHYFGGAAQSNVVYATRTPGGADQASTTFNSNMSNAGVATADQNAQEIFSYVIDAVGFALYRHGRKYQTANFGGNHTANMALAPLTNKDMVFGGRPTSPSSGALQANRAHILIGPIVITKKLNDDAKRTGIRTRINRACQQHRIKDAATILSYFDKVVLFKNADAAARVAMSIDGSFGLQFSNGFAYGAAAPQCGYKGVYAPSDTDYTLGMKALSTYFAGVTTGAVMALVMRDATGNSGTYGNDLSHAFVQGNGEPPTTAVAAANWSMSWGAFDHNTVSFTAMVASPARDPNALTSTRQYFDNTPFGALVYDFKNQPKGKYIRNTSHGTFFFGETFGTPAITYTQQVWANQDFTQGQKALDAPTGPDVLDNGFGNDANGANSFKSDCLMLHVVNFEAPAGYDRAASYADRMAIARKAKNTSYIAVGETPIGHLDGSIAINRNAVVVDSADDARIMSHNFQRGFKGYRFAVGLKANGILTQDQVEEIHVNIDKLVA